MKQSNNFNDKNYIFYESIEYQLFCKSKVETYKSKHMVIVYCVS